MKQALLIVAVLGGGSALATFVALFCAISFGTFNLDPDSLPGSRWGDALAIAAGASVLAFVIFAARSRGLFSKCERMPEETLIVLTTWPDADSARAAARTLVDERLAACGNIVPGVESIYRWEGAVETNAEVLVIFKTTAARYPQLEARIKALHSYKVPEIVSMRVVDGLPSYFGWVGVSCSVEA